MRRNTFFAALLGLALFFGSLVPSADAQWRRGYVTSSYYPTYYAPGYSSSYYPGYTTYYTYPGYTSSYYSSRHNCYNCGKRYCNSNSNRGFWNAQDDNRLV